MNLRFNDDFSRTEPTRDSDRFLRRRCHSARGGGHAKLLEEFASLIFVDVQV